jgi:phosphoglucomutase
MAAWHKTRGQTLHDVLNDLFERVGWHHDRVESFAFAGANGMKSMKRIMDRLFEKQPGEVAGVRVLEVRDYRALRSVRGSEVSAIDSPPSDVLIFLLEKNQRLIIRPSGTEPKLKIYSLASAANMEEAQKKTLALAQSAAKLLGVSNAAK